MRSITCGFNISIDGCYDHTKFSGGDDILEYFAKTMQNVDLHFTGRKMYELMTPYWPEVAKNQSGTAAANTFAKTYSAIENVVVSRTMEEVPGGPRIVRTNIVEELQKLKALPGKKISIGGMSLRGQLMKLGLIDELDIVIHPVVVGSGARLFDDIDLAQPVNMELVSTETLRSGCVVLHYKKRQTS